MCFSELARVLCKHIWENLSDKFLGFFSHQHTLEGEGPGCGGKRCLFLFHKNQARLIYHETKERKKDSILFCIHYLKPPLNHSYIFLPLRWHGRYAVVLIEKKKTLVANPVLRAVAFTWAFFSRCQSFLRTCKILASWKFNRGYKNDIIKLFFKWISGGSPLRGLECPLFP